MASGARTFGLQETFAEPQVLPPPPVRHALLFFLTALAAILHLGTAGWSEIHNGAEGLYVGSAREMLVSEAPLLPRSNGRPVPDEPPLLHWLLLTSFKLFGVSVAAARVPIALAFVASVALTFLIGERLAGYWRGFTASMIYLGSFGAYAWPRFVTPEPLFAACIAAAVLCAVAGYQRKQTRRIWFAAFWLAAGAAYLTRGAFALLLVALIIGVPALCFRESRMRFRALFHWTGIAGFAAIVTPWLIVVLDQSAEPLLQRVWIAPFARSSFVEQLSATPVIEFAGAHLLWWFPTLLLVLPGVLFAWRKVIRPHEFAFVDALPLCWLLTALLPLLLQERQHEQSIVLWSGFALAAASAWERTTSRLQLAGIITVAVAGVTAALAIARGSLVLPSLGRSAFQQGEGAFLILTAIALTICCVGAAYLAWHQRGTLAITTLLVATVPIGLGSAESIARNSPFLSFARVGQFLQSPPARGGEVLFEGSHADASSLLFYLDERFALVGEISRDEANAASLTPADTLERMAQPNRVYLIIHKDRVPFWQAQLTERFHIYHQVTTCGAHVVVNNHP